MLGEICSVPSCTALSARLRLHDIRQGHEQTRRDRQTPHRHHVKASPAERRMLNRALFDSITIDDER